MALVKLKDLLAEALTSLNDLMDEADAEARSADPDAGDFYPYTVYWNIVTCAEDTLDELRDLQSKLPNGD